MPDTTTFRAVMNQQSPNSAAPAIEPLESRIAPATIFVGNPNANDTEYIEAQGAVFIDTETSSDPLALQVGKGVEGVNDTFILRLTAGDQVILFAPGGDSVFLDLKAGKAAAFFVDHNLDNEVQATELTGLSLGQGAVMTVKGTVFGDVVTNLTANGDLDIESGVHGLVSPTQGLNKFSANDVAGGIITGGKITNLAAGAVGKVLTGNAANGEAYDFFRPDPGNPGAPDVPGGGGTLTVTTAPGVAGPNIQNVLVKSIGDRMQAGTGGIGAKGGSITNAEVTADSDGFIIAAGHGGAGDASRPSGGAGGILKNIVVSGFADTTPNSTLHSQLLAGDGGDGTSIGKGGAGGLISNVNVGFDKRGNKILPSSDVSMDGLLIQAGTGGDGRTAGKGGVISSTKARISVQAELGDEFVVRAGAGGNTVSGGKAGAGGAVTNVDFQNLNPVISDSIVRVTGGDGGTAPLDATGASGGAISKIILLGEGIFVNAGNGSSGKVGGKGGAITTLSTVLSDIVTPRDVTINSGSGGNGSSGNAGVGGSISKVTIESTDFTNFTVNGGTSANGGTSTGGRGGAGGSLSRFSVLEIPLDTGLEGAISVRAGNAGDGTTGGGAGGSIGNFLLSGFNTTLDVTAGSGGSATTSGKGGGGGSINTARFASGGSVAGVQVDGNIAAGIGGNGKGASGSGGAGGSIKGANINVDGDMVVSAGNGGSGEGGASGKGGSVSKTGAFSEFGSGSLLAGDAGIGGSKPGAGGSILAGSNLRANLAITIQAGDGQSGGAGGNITAVNFSSSASSLLPAPLGNIVLQAGNGSALGSFAGRGGTISQVIGFASSGVNGTTTFTGGNGGGGGTNGAAGGSIQNLQIVGGGSDTALMTITAGDAGDATGQATGAAGGDVTSVEIAGLEVGTILRSIAAGDGGNGTGHGGRGGNVQKTFVLATDIGDRFGGDYGYTTMGGIFAGLGGTGAVAGLNGSVTDIRAESIAAIVAGRGASPDFAERVEKITIATSNVPVDLLKVEDSDFDLSDGGDLDYGTVVLTAYQTNNLIGFYRDPLQPDTNKFHFTDVDMNGVYSKGDVPLDGLIQAKVINLKTFNSTPEAYLTLTGFFDYNNRIS
jgi:hypothetical protein